MGNVAQPVEHGFEGRGDVGGPGSECSAAGEVAEANEPVLEVSDFLYRW